jgi:hypothetical protein
MEQVFRFGINEPAVQCLHRLQCLPSFCSLLAGVAVFGVLWLLTHVANGLGCE